jgi:hypothetical protein
MLSTYLDTGSADGVHRFRYSDVGPADKEALRSFVGYLQRQRPGAWSQPASMPYWINLYNAATVLVVLDHLPIKSILDIRLDATPETKGPWDAKLLTVEGRALSLNDIEHRILRPTYGDPRIHFALNCASVGCPNLAPAPFDEANLEPLLEKGARDFVRSPRGVARHDGGLRLSSIFDWYRADFGKSEKEMLESLLRWTHPDSAAKLKNHRGKITYAYDWSLNG